MGCNIHGSIEYKRWDGDSPYWRFAGNLGERDYAMFGLLADVRGSGCMFQPRGVPSDMSSSTKWEYCLFVSDDPDADNAEGMTTKQKANEWVANGSSEWADEKHDMVTHPDWHTPSWLTTEEFESVLIERKKMEYPPDCEWDAILAAMKALPNARFVFWFDN